MILDASANLKQFGEDRDTWRRLWNF